MGKKINVCALRSVDKPQESALQVALMLFVTALSAYPLLSGVVLFHSFLWCVLVFKKKKIVMNMGLPQPTCLNSSVRSDRWLSTCEIFDGKFHGGRNGIADAVV